MHRVGFIIDDRLPSLASTFAGRCGPLELLRGSPSSSPSTFMRFGWIAGAVTAVNPELVYELYRPHRRYDALVFVKSMSVPCRDLARSARDNGIRVVFDANVDYYTPFEGRSHFDGMAPSVGQREAALEMARLSHAMIADSEHIADICKPLHRNVAWVSDNVLMDLVPPASHWSPEPRLPLLWSGEATKLFELLLIEDVLKTLAPRIRLVLITSDLDAAFAKWSPDYASRIRSLLETIEHRLIRFTDIPNLLSVYAAENGIFISPRFLDNTYNLGHTEWKITLPMACGRVVFCSPQRSYETVAALAGSHGIRICRGREDWLAAFDCALTGRLDYEAEGKAAFRVVDANYATPIVAAKHSKVLMDVLRK